MSRTRVTNQVREQDRAGQALKWIGAGALLFGVLPVVVITAADLPGIIREIKIQMMSRDGGWKRAR